MRPVGKHRLLRCEVAVKPKTVLTMSVNNLLAPSEQLNELNMPFAPEPVSGAA